MSGWDRVRINKIGGKDKDKQLLFYRVSSLMPARFWINRLTREEAYKAIEVGAVGCSPNPAYPRTVIFFPSIVQGFFCKFDQVLPLKEKERATLNPSTGSGQALEKSNMFSRRTSGRCAGQPLIADLVEHG